MKTCGEMDEKLHTFLISVIDIGKWSASRSGHYSPEESSLSTHCEIGWEAGWPQSPFGCGAPGENRIPTVELVANYHSERGSPAHTVM
jgi:hypothetical protein